jgi:hypothetical protein
MKTTMRTMPRGTMPPSHGGVSKDESRDSGQAGRHDAPTGRHALRGTRAEGVGRTGESASAYARVMLPTAPLREPAYQMGSQFWSPAWGLVAIPVPSRRSTNSSNASSNGRLTTP